MKKLLYIPAVIFGLHALISFFAAGYFMLTHDNGSAALYIIFVFGGMFVSTFLFALAKE